jgi:hypothetical protein
MTQMAVVINVGVDYVLEREVFEPVQGGLDIYFSGANALKELREI